MSWSGTVTCSHCYRQGHNKRKCPTLTEQIKDQYHGATSMAAKERAAGNESDAQYYDDRAENRRQLYMKRTKFDLATGEKVSNKASKAARMKNVTCGYCHERGHTRRICPKVKNDKQVFVEQTRRERMVALKDAVNLGIGVGSMLPIRTSGYDSDGEWGMQTQLRYVKKIDWDGCVANRSKLSVIHVDARKIAAPNQMRWTSRDTIEGLKESFGQARDYAHTMNEKSPMTSLIPSLDPPTGWLKPTEQSLKDALKREFPTTGNQYNKRRKFYYQWPEGNVMEIIKDLGLEEHYKQS
jgi:hypothetical protein